MIDRVARVIAAAGCVAFALLALTSSAMVMDGAVADRQLWLLVYAGFTVSLAALWIGAWAVGGRNPLGRRPEHAWTRRPRRLLLAAGALAHAVLVGGFLIYSVGIPPVGADPATLAMILLVMAGSTYGAATVARVRGAAGRRVVLWMGAWSVVMIVVAAVRLPYTVAGPVGPALALSLIVAGSMWGAVAIAGLLVWSVRGAWHLPAVDPLSQSPVPSHPAHACSES